MRETRRRTRRGTWSGWLHCNAVQRDVLGSLALIHRVCCAGGWCVCFVCCMCGVHGPLALGHRCVVVVGGVGVVCVVCAMSMAPWRSVTVCVVVVGGVGVVCVVCAVSLAPWRSFTACAAPVGGVGALCAACAVSMAPWRSFTACVVVVGGVGVVCVVCVVSMAPWRSFTACAAPVGGVCALCAACAVSMAPWRSFTACAAPVGQGQLKGAAMWWIAASASMREGRDTKQHLVLRCICMRSILHIVVLWAKPGRYGPHIFRVLTSSLPSSSSTDRARSASAHVCVCVCVCVCAAGFDRRCRHNLGDAILVE